MPFNAVKIGKQISYILRHRPQSANITLDENGYAPTEQLIKHLDITQDQLDYIVDNNDKKRYSYNEDKSLIRASQGHSVKVDLELKPQVPPDILYHGTSMQKMNVILKLGLLPMNRHHVHLSVDRDTAVNVGKRHGRPWVFSIDAAKMHKDGHEFFLSDNGVWLTEKVKPKYFL